MRHDGALFLAVPDLALRLRALAQMADPPLRRGLMAAAVEIERIEADTPVQARL